MLVYPRRGSARPLTEADREIIAQQNGRLAEKGLRVLASAFREIDALPIEHLDQETVERELVFVGLSGLYDPPRPEAKEAVVKCRAAGVRVVMITGDHPRTALAIGRELGLGDDGRSTTGIEIDRLTDDELRRLVPMVAVYARVSAAHKLRIVRAWQANDAVVAMTGDGVNDAPAIKGADIGIAMGRSGTEVTKQASDMIVTDDNFATIVAAVEEGRGIYDNIRKTLQYLLACNASELLLMAICIVMGLPMPLLPIHLLWINLVTDGPPALCLAADRVDPQVMKRRPRMRGERLADENFLWAMLLTATLISGVAFLAFLHGLQSGGAELARTYAFTTMVFAQLLMSLGSRSQTTPIWRLGLFSNFNLFMVVSVLIAIQIWSQQSGLFSHFLGTTQLPYLDAWIIFALSALPLLVLEIVKAAPRTFAADGCDTSAPTTIWIKWTTAGALAVMIVGSWFNWPQSREPATQFVTQKIERGPVIKVVAATGVVRSRPTTEVLAPLSGIVQFRDCEVGKRVTKGQLCATIEQRPFRHAVEREQAKIADVRAELDKRISMLAHAELNWPAHGCRAHRAGSVKKQSLTSGPPKFAMRGEARKLQREAALGAAKADLERTEIRAPMTGTVTSQDVKTGQTVVAGRTTLFMIANLDASQIDVTLSPSDIEK